ncbi:hypothetical protein HanHA300_Chr12g0450661 [Helianthus annuus]|nr:hypothetical protein HanHA300_Chr12g0450661 [Helianthus annuus]
MNKFAGEERFLLWAVCSIQLQDQQYGDGDLEMGTQHNANSGELGLNEFFKKVQSIEKQYEKLNKLLKNYRMPMRSQRV